MATTYTKEQKPIPTDIIYLLKEDGDFILKEDGFKIIVKDATTGTTYTKETKP